VFYELLSFLEKNKLYLSTTRAICNAVEWAMGKERSELAIELLKSIPQWAASDYSQEGMVAKRNRNIYLLSNYEDTADFWLQVKGFV